MTPNRPGSMRVYLGGVIFPSTLINCRVGLTSLCSMPWSKFIGFGIAKLKNALLCAWYDARPAANDWNNNNNTQNKRHHVNLCMLNTGSRVVWWFCLTSANEFLKSSANILKVVLCLTNLNRSLLLVNWRLLPRWQTNATWEKNMC